IRAQPSGDTPFRRLELLDHFEEAVEHVDVVERARRGLRMVLYRNDGLTTMAQSFAGTVIEVHLRNLDIAGEALGIDGVAVVLRGDVHAVALEVLHGVVGAAVAELELEGPGPKGAPEDLVAEADAKNRGLADERLNGRDLVVEERRVAGPG